MTEAQLLRGPAGQVLVVRTSSELSKEAEGPLLEMLQQIGRATGLVIVCPPEGMTLEQLDETEMRAAGWLKITTLQRSAQELKDSGAVQVHGDPAKIHQLLEDRISRAASEWPPTEHHPASRVKLGLDEPDANSPAMGLRPHVIDE